jgi:hypothetical protein
MLWNGMHVEKTKLMGISWEPFSVQIVTDQEQLENVEYFVCWGSMIANDARRTREMKSRLAMAKETFNREKTFHQQTGLKYKEETGEVLHLEHS